MEETVFYIGEGDSTDKQNTASFGIVASTNSSKHHFQFRQCYSSKSGYASTGTGYGHRLFCACKGKALVHVYCYGKESPEQKMPVPEELTCLDIALQNGEPWLLAGGGKSGKLYLWEIQSGLLLLAKDSHYQHMTALKFSKDASFLISGGADSRVLCWKTLDLLQHDDALKPHCVFSDHTLPVSDIVLTPGLVNDIKAYTVSHDSTIRCYHMLSKSLLTTFVAPWGIESIALDPAQRCLYIGSVKGSIRQVRLYQPNNESLLTAVGGAGKIVTLPADTELRETFTHHADSSVSVLETSTDGMTLVSGDVSGKAFVSDIVSKQVVRRLKPLNAAIAGVFVSAVNYERLEKDARQLRPLPALKRSLAEKEDIAAHSIWTQVHERSEAPHFNITQFLEKTQREQQAFVNWNNVESSVSQKSNIKSSTNNNTNTELETMTANYNKLKEMYQELLKQHEELLK